MTIVKTLKALYERLGGTPSDVANATRAVDVLNAIAALYDGTDDATRITKAIANIVAVASGLIKPSGTKSITANGTGIDVANYATANVNVDDGSATIKAMVDGSLTSIVLPNGLTTIRTYAFEKCAHLTSVYIPNSVTSIEEYAFQLCTSLESVNIPDGITVINNGVFDSCSLTSIQIPNGVLKIGINAFRGCKFTSVTIPNGVTEIDIEAFDSCSQLHSAYIPSTVVKFGTSAFCSQNLTDIYYTGTQVQWEAITGLSDAGIPAGCTIHYEYTPS